MSGVHAKTRAFKDLNTNVQRGCITKINLVFFKFYSMSFNQTLRLHHFRFNRMGTTTHMTSFYQNRTQLECKHSTGVRIRESNCAWTLPLNTMSCKSYRY